MMEYRGYIGRVEFDDEAGVFHGEVINTRDVITFQGTSVEELRTAFQDSVDDYLAFCAERGEAPDKPFSGQFVVRVSPEVHRSAYVASQKTGKSLNTWVSEVIAEAAAPARPAPVKRPPLVGAKKAAQKAAVFRKPAPRKPATKRPATRSAKHASR